MPSPRSRLRSLSRRPFLEELERRLVPTMFTVNTTADSVAGSLRDAIVKANADMTPGTDVIQFAIASSGVQRIQLAAASGPLPAITRSVVIDGSTEGGFTGTPLIVLDGSALSTGDGLDLAAANCTIKALAIGGFTNGSGILIGPSGSTGIVNTLVTACYIGTDATGATPLANRNGIQIDHGAAGNTVGGTTAGAGNVIAGNQNDGILITGAGTTGNVVLGNLVGLQPGGTAALGNKKNGLEITSSGNLVGGTVAAARNVISGNGKIATDDGLLISGNNNVVQSNYFGTDITGTAALGNAGAGILISGGAGNTIGGSPVGVSVTNVISGNLSSGLVLAGAGATGNLVEANLIGLQSSPVKVPNVPLRWLPA